AVAIGERADGLIIDLDAVRKKYDGLDGTELAISESQERMAVVVAPEDAEAFIAAARAENLEAYQVAVVTAEPRMVMRWQGKTIVSLSREFLNSNGAVKHARVSVPAKDRFPKEAPPCASLREMASSLKCASRRGLVERFDSTIGAGSVAMPYGGKTQRTPAQSMAALLPVLPGQETEQASVMAWGFDPEAMNANPYRGAYEAVTVSLAKLVASGADYKTAYLTLQEYFEKLRQDPERWGRPFAALLGAMEAQMDFGAAAIGGKDSMSGSFLDLDVPPTLVSFAVAPIKAGEVITPEFKETGHPVYLFDPHMDDLPEGQKETWETFHALCRAGKVKAAWAVENSVSEGIIKMSFGNCVGFSYNPHIYVQWHASGYQGTILAELTEDIEGLNAYPVGITTAEPVITIGTDSVSIDELLSLSEAVLEDVYPTRAPASGEAPLLD
ncbi:MAG: phosphoribosylformylglycinamidine synthase, partial [Dysosmobacter sp.]|nr:phosphoribosylformylglycinamidine synthase [Dysosmobacter sp.]